MKTHYLLFLNVLFIASIFAGCGQMNLQQQEKIAFFVGEEAIVDQTKADYAKKIILSMGEVIEVRGVSNEENIYIAPAVKHFDRLHLKDIRSDGFARIKKRYPDAKVHVSTDKKIFMELEKLENKLREKTISKEDFTKRLKKLEEEMKG